MVLSGYIPAAATIFTKLQHAVAIAAASTCFGLLNQSQPNPTVHANGGFTQPFAHFLLRCDSGHI